MAKSKKKLKELTGLTDELFDLLDETKLSDATIIRSDLFKEHYESLVMFAFRKLQAARYHQGRVNELIESKANQIDKLLSHGVPNSKVATATIKTRSTANEFAFELCAFLAAIRSAIDFLARVCAAHSKGHDDTTSITTFLKALKNGKKGPLLGVIGKHKGWLEHLQSYRDYLVHRLVISTNAGGQRTWKNGVLSTTIYPVIVPTETPKHVPDTRRARLMEEPAMNFNVATSEAVAIFPDGTRTILENTTAISPGSGYIRIEDLMKREMEAFELFFHDFIDAVISLKFEWAPIK
jgi:hypothetical protein